MTEALYLVKPVLMERHCGGWLAITPRGWPLAIGVTGDTEEEARRAFDAALERWSRIPYITDGEVEYQSWQFAALEKP